MPDNARDTDYLPLGAGRPALLRIRCEKRYLISWGLTVLFLKVVDLFAGSGALGLEALSRWGGTALFVDSSRAAVECLRKNIGLLKMEEKAQVIQRDLLRGAKFLNKVGGPFDLIFMDPPYGQGWCNLIIPSLLSLPILEEKGVLVLEHDLKEPLPGQVGDWGIEDQRRYGKTRVSFYKSMKR